MNDFKSYTQNGGNSGQGRTNGAGAQNGSSSDNSNLNQTVNMATMLAKAFNGKSEAQILQTILAQAEQGKRDGTLTNADLDNFYSTLAPLLDGFKRKKLQSVIQRLKSI